MTFNCFRRAFAAVLGVAAAPAFAVSVGMVDTFDGGSTNGWGSGDMNPSPPVNVATGGPLGVGDGYLEVISSGPAGPVERASGKLVAFSGPQWAGDYIGAGVTAIEMDVNNFGGTDLDLRLGFERAVGFVEAFSSNAIQVSAGSGWSHISFPVDPASLTGSVVASLSAATQFRLYHSPNATVSGPEIAALLGVDNVTAVPEPGTWLSLLVGLVTLVAGKNVRGRGTR